MENQWNVTDNCTFPLSSLSFLPQHQTFDPEYVQLVWPCEVRSYWVHINPFVNSVKFLLSYVTAVVVVLGLIMNTLTFLILNTTPIRNTSLSVFLRALAISDNGALLFNFAIGVARSHVSSISDLYLDNVWLCGVSKVLVDLFLFNSTWLVVGLTIKRLLVIGCPMKFGVHCSAKAARRIVTLIGICAFSISCLKLKYSGYEQDSTFGFKPCKFNADTSVNAIYFYIAFSTWLPCLSIFIGNVLLVVQVHSSNKDRSKLSEDKTAMKRFKMALLIAVSLTCLMMLLPLGIVETFELYWDAVLIKKPAATPVEQQQYIRWQQEKLLLKWVRGFFFFIYQWNFAINFFLYCLTGTIFRQAAEQYFRNSLCMSSFTAIRRQLSKFTRSTTTKMTELEIQNNNAVQVEMRPMQETKV